MSDTILNPQNMGYNPKSQSNYQSILSKNVPNTNPKNIFRTSNNPILVPPGTYIPFSERVEQSPYLISLEQKKGQKERNKFIYIKQR